MGRVGDRLIRHQRLGLDSSVLIYQLESNERYIDLTMELFVGIQEGVWSAVVSAVSLMEVTVRPRRLHQEVVATEYETLIMHFPNLTVQNVTRDVAREASRLRALLNVRPADGLILGSAIIGGASAFITNDRALTRAHPHIDIVLLEDLLDEAEP